MKQNFTLDKTKRNKILLVFLFHKTSKILWNNFLLHVVSCFVKQNKKQNWKPYSYLICFQWLQDICYMTPMIRGHICLAPIDLTPIVLGHILSDSNDMRSFLTWLQWNEVISDQTPVILGPSWHDPNDMRSYLTWPQWCEIISDLSPIMWDHIWPDSNDVRSNLTWPQWDEAIFDLTPMMWGHTWPDSNDVSSSIQRNNACFVLDNVTYLKCFINNIDGLWKFKIY
jgi:hypothetical protein